MLWISKTCCLRTRLREPIAKEHQLNPSQVGYVEKGNS